MQRGGGVVVFVHINESATPGCKCLATLLKGRLPVHVCRVLCCCSVTLIYGDLFCLQGFKLLFQCRISFSPTARKIQFLRAVGDVFYTFLGPHAKTDPGVAGKLNISKKNGIQI